MRTGLWWAVLAPGSALCLILGAGPDTATLVFAQDLAFTAAVDKTTVNVGEPIKLTITLGGDLTGVQLPPLELPEGLAVAAQSQSTNFAVRGGAAERSMSLVYIIIPQQAGSFELGPFAVTHRRKKITTDPIKITVEKPAVPPSLKSAPGERFTL
jgi:hypothetical protein